MCETPIFSPVFHSASTSFIISQAGEWEVKSISFSYTPLFGTINIQIIAQIVLICYSVGILGHANESADIVLSSVLLSETRHGYTMAMPCMGDWSFISPAAWEETW